MARIRSVKPDFWTDERVVECSFEARLFFIGIKNFMDDYGRIEYRPKSLKMMVFPADSVDVEALVDELQKQGLCRVYEVDGQRYLADMTFADTQKIDKRSPSKHPEPPNSAEPPRIPTPEGKGMEGKGEGGESTLANAKVGETGVPPCPHLEIIEAYHRLLPMGRRVNPELWNGTRATHLKARWRENPKRQNLEWWERFFGYIGESKFLTGQVPPSPGRTPFELNLDWVVNPTNFAKIHEGSYHK